MTEPSFKLQGRCTGGLRKPKTLGVLSCCCGTKPLLVGFCFVMGGIVQCLLSLLHYVIW